MADWEKRKPSASHYRLAHSSTWSERKGERRCCREPTHWFVSADPDRAKEHFQSPRNRCWPRGKTTGCWPECRARCGNPLPPPDPEYVCILIARPPCRHQSDNHFHTSRCERALNSSVAIIKKRERNPSMRPARHDQSSCYWSPCHRGCIATPQFDLTDKSPRLTCKVQAAAGPRKTCRNSCSRPAPASMTPLPAGW